MIRYEQILAKELGTKYLLLGNGFSIACDERFKYQNLFEFAKQIGISKQAIEVFEYVGTNNFEGVMHLLEDTQEIIKIYGLGKTTSIKSDLRVIKKSLVEAVGRIHLPYPASIPDNRKNACVNFFRPYKHIFSTNYDLLPYWVSMHGHETLKMQDGFRAPEDDPEEEYLVFSEPLGKNSGILFLHGALHIYLEDGDVRKYSWKRSQRPIIELMKEGLDKGQYPIFVAEGLPEKKLTQIRRNGYLSYCFGKFERIQSPLIIFGHSLGESDRHILDSISNNVDLPRIYIGLHGAPKSKSNLAIIEKAESLKEHRKKILKQIKHGLSLEVDYFDSTSVPVWG